MPGLPPFVDPMLARAGKPFDSEDHLFEVKWDGTRAIAFVERGAIRAHNRKRRDLMLRYPELQALVACESGVVLDGELVVLGEDGKPEFRGMLKREQARTADRARRLAAEMPATYVVFDVLFRNNESLMDRPLRERREHLREIVSRIGDPRVVLSEGVVGAGLAFFDEIQRLSIEGMVAKDLDSLYHPGRRTDAWRKIKPKKHLHCVVLGYQLRDDGGLRSLIIGAPVDGTLRYVGRVGSGIGHEQAVELLRRLKRIPRAEPLVECGADGHWVEPEIYCLVGYLERNATGTLRAPVFHGCVEA